ncbi:RAMP superfamily CRISPR-associated protein [Athalassotoga sp.]|uniref:RAMP superfamily CRISPR-associated protein n=1 Tax=Athalassotoga sp. TaxID=2022597 RepID=UPI003D00A8C7
MKIKISIKLLSPLLIGSSKESYGIAKSQLAYNNMALITGSELKGNLRYIFKTIPALNKFEVPLFGDSNSAGKLLFETLQLENPSYIERMGVSIDRNLKVSANEKLFTVRALNHPDRSFEGYIKVNGKLSESEKSSLVTAANLIDKIGSMKSRGFGKVKIDLDFVEDQNTIPENIEEGIYEMIFKVKSPIILTAEMAKTYLYTSRTFVSGETLKGAYAEFFDKNSDIFKQIFNHGRVHFPFLYPSSNNRSLIPSPQTLFTQKHSNGEMIYDITLGKYIERLFAEKGLKYILTDKTIKDGKEIRLEPAKGYFDPDKSTLYSLNSQKFFSTQIEIDPFTKTAKSGILRSYDAFYPDYLGGYLKVNSQNKDLVKEIIGHKEIQIGNSRTRGFGHLELHSVQKINDDFSSSLKIANDAFKEIVDKINQMNGTKDFEIKNTIVPVVLTSDLIEKDFENLFGEGFNLKMAFTRRQNISGYSTYSKSNKTLYNSIVAGSVFVFENDKDLNSVSQILSQKRYKGLGYLTESGFGDFSIYIPLKGVQRRRLQ